MKLIQPGQAETPPVCRSSSSFRYLGLQGGHHIFISAFENKYNLNVVSYDCQYLTFKQHFPILTCIVKVLFICLSWSFPGHSFISLWPLKHPHH